MDETVEGPAAQARRALPLLDLTELGDHATAADVSALCTRANGPLGPVAAVCVWPRFVAQAKAALAGTPVRVATVINFPQGTSPRSAVFAEAEAALAAGADELDLVLPYARFAAGDTEKPGSLIDGVRALVPRDGHLLKVILETGELHQPTAIGAASRLAIRHGADFIKTSTGKTKVSATLAATAVMLSVIRELGEPVGLKPSGGIRTVADATAYLLQADDVMGPHWATPHTFRFGASGLLNALEAAINGDAAAATSRSTY